MAKRKFSHLKKKESNDLKNEGENRQRRLAPLKEKKTHYRKWLDEEDDGDEDIQLFEKEEE